MHPSHYALEKLADALQRAEASFIQLSQEYQNLKVEYDALKAKHDECEAAS